jgi:uncharacterized protein (TIGR02271 family)
MKVRYLEASLTNNARGPDTIRIPAERVDLDDTVQCVIVRQTRSELAAFGVGGQLDSSAIADERQRTADAAAASDDLVGRADALTDEGEAGRLTRAEEEVRVGTRPVQAGEVVVSKQVETERVTTPVSRRVEHVRIERRPVSGASAASPELGEGEIRVPVIEEEVVVEKRPVIKEEIVVSRHAETETEQVETDVRRERVDVEGDEQLVDADGVTPRRAGTGGRRG